MNVAVVGLGLIGGSLAKAIKRAGGHSVYGCDRDGQVQQRALREGAIDQVLDERNLARCQIVLVALYPQAVVDYVRAQAQAFAPGALVIDCAGVKRCVCEALEREVAGAGFVFLGGHPMAGREFSGFDAARENLFDGAWMILAPEPGTPRWATDEAEAFFAGLGFAGVRWTTPREHDRMIALTSQLAHVVSSAYAQSPAAAMHSGFSAGSFQDMTRVARLNEEMWTELFLDNADLLLEELDGLIARLGQYRQALQARDQQGLRGLLRQGREAKEALEDGEEERACARLKSNRETMKS